MPAEGGAPPESSSPTTPLAARRSRWAGMQYADINKLRELAARQDRAAARARQRIARLNTHIEKLRHQAAVLREKGQKVLEEIPEIEQQIAQFERDIKVATGDRPGAPVSSDVTNLHYRIRKLQQKIVDRQQKARHLELRAAQRTQKTSEIKVKVDRFNETALLAEQEATSYRQRADRLQMVAEQDAGAPSAGAAPPTAPPPPDAGSPP